MNAIELAHKQWAELERDELIKEINLIKPDTGYLVSKNNVTRLFGSVKILKISLIGHDTKLVNVTEQTNGNVSITRYRDIPTHQTKEQIVSSILNSI